MLDNSEITVKRSCELAGLSRTGWYRPPNESIQNLAIRHRLRQLASERPAFGSPRLTILLQREFGSLNHKRIERLYAEEGLQLPRRPKRRRRGVSRPLPRIEPTAPGQRASMDFMHDVLADGRRIRMFTLVDNFSREWLAIEVDTSLSGQRVSRTLEALRLADRLPGTIVCDNGTEFTSKAMLKWSLDNGIKLNFIEPGKPTQNAYIESFNGKFRQECLRQHWFESLHEAREIVETWRQDYNQVRPHSSLEYRTPQEVVLQHEMNKNLASPSHWVCVR
jgi:putative transposase